MRLFLSMSRASLALVLLLISVCAPSEEQKINSGPVAVNNLITSPLSHVFPLDPKPDGMRVRCPILLDDRTILSPDAVLRFVYNKPIGGERPHGPMKVAHVGESTATADQGSASSSQGRHHRGGMPNIGGSGNKSTESGASDQNIANNESDQNPEKNDGSGGAYGDQGKKIQYGSKNFST